MSSRKYIFVFILFILTSCEEYSRHYQSEYAQYQEGIYSTESLLTSTLSILPNLQEKDHLVSTFDQAHGRIWVEIYTWTEKNTVDAVIRAHNRWVDVRVILEGNVYNTPRINDATYKKLQWAWVPVVFSDNKKYTFTHAKFWIIDDSYCVSTGNFTYSAFQKNRDIIVCDQDRNVLSVLEEVYRADEAHVLPLFSGPVPLNIGMSPLNMRSRLVHYIQSAHTSISVYVQSLSDRGILNLLEAKKKEWLDVLVCLADNESARSLTGYTFPIVFVKKPYLHAKSILIDGEKIMVGSINLTENGIDRNREVSLFYYWNQSIYDQIEKTFTQDCIF